MNISYFYLIVAWSLISNFTYFSPFDRQISSLFPPRSKPCSKIYIKLNRLYSIYKQKSSSRIILLVTSAPSFVQIIPGRFLISLALTTLPLYTIIESLSLPPCISIIPLLYIVIYVEALKYPIKIFGFDSMLTVFGSIITIAIWCFDSSAIFFEVSLLVSTLGIISDSNFDYIAVASTG